jgi:hypothetical protein
VVLCSLGDYRQSPGPLAFGLLLEQMLKPDPELKPFAIARH